MPIKRGPRRSTFPALAALALFLISSLLLMRWHTYWAPGLGLLDGLVIGAVLGATGLVRSYDESWDEFFEATMWSYLLGIFAVVVYWLRRESPSAFFWVECAAGTLSYLTLTFVPPITWLAADLLLFAGTFAGWFFSGLFRPGYS